MPVAPFLLLLAAGVAAAPGCESLAIFSTVCARCHEAECSGRLGLGGGAESARAHLERFTGPLLDDRAGELFELLRVTKEACRVDVRAATDCGAGDWDAERLERAHVPAERAWFAPLGAPEAGPRRVALRFDRDTAIAARISTARFETLHESSSSTQDATLVLAFDAPGDEVIFLHLGVEGEARLVELRVR
jgi:hypothetical protein